MGREKEYGVSWGKKKKKKKIKNKKEEMRWDGGIWNGGKYRRREK